MLISNILSNTCNLCIQNKEIKDRYVKYLMLKRMEMWVPVNRETEKNEKKRKEKKNEKKTWRKVTKRNEKKTKRKKTKTKQ